MIRFASVYVCTVYICVRGQGWTKLRKEESGRRNVLMKTEACVGNETMKRGEGGHAHR